MKYRPLIILISGLVLGCHLNATCQFSPMRSTISTPGGKVPITYNVYTPGFYGNSGVTSNKYIFTVVLLNDSLVQGRTKINIKDSIRSVTFRKRKTKIIYKPTDTKQLYRITPKGDKIIGIPNDSCWLFKTGKGKINFFSYLAEPGTEAIIAMQVGDEGPIVPIQKKQVLLIVNEYPDLIKQAEKGKLIKALRGFNKKN